MRSNGSKAVIVLRCKNSNFIIVIICDVPPPTAAFLCVATRVKHHIAAVARSNVLESVPNTSHNGTPASLRLLRSIIGVTAVLQETDTGRRPPIAPQQIPFVAALESPITKRMPTPCSNSQDHFPDHFLETTRVLNHRRHQALSELAQYNPNESRRKLMRRFSVGPSPPSPDQRESCPPPRRTLRARIAGCCS
jgi:hypothetical protein